MTHDPLDSGSERLARIESQLAALHTDYAEDHQRLRAIEIELSKISNQLGQLLELREQQAVKMDKLKDRVTEIERWRDGLVGQLSVVIVVVTAAVSVVAAWLSSFIKGE